FFDEALRATPSFTEAFARARAAVGTREAAEGLEASEPQIAVGRDIKPRLEVIYNTPKEDRFAQRSEKPNP
ncbi:MAG: hypothetical protein RBS46_15745, partial [Methyloversatilis sp.]|nr:hypothetical protein [Methyloversatilis sp.]